MTAESRLVHIVDDVPELDGARDAQTDLTLVSALDGFLDAGNAAALAAQHLIRASTDAGGPNLVVATFEIDELHDYRARRPAITFARDHYEQYEAPRLVVRLLHDAGGTPFLLMHGPEPDIRWEAFARAVREVVTRFSVNRMINLASVPMAVPHTRQMALTQHANAEDLIDYTSPWTGELRVPSSASALLEIRLGEWGHPALGFVAHIPHYLAQLDYPHASVALLEQVEKSGRITVDLTELRELATERDVDIARYLNENDELADVVEALERQYDTFSRAEAEGENLLAEEQPLPTGEEIGKQFEQFLADLEGGDRGNDESGGDR